MRTAANRITLVRFFLVPFFLLLLYSGMNTGAFIVYIISCVSDFADGYVARHFNQASDFGRFADPLADKILTASAMCFFVQHGQMPGWALAAVLFREFAVSGLRMVAADKGLVIAAAVSGKVKTFLTMAALGVMLLFPSAKSVNIICWIVILVSTLMSGAEYFIKNGQVFKDG